MVLSIMIVTTIVLVHLVILTLAIDETTSEVQTCCHHIQNIEFQLASISMSTSQVPQVKAVSTFI